MAQLNPEQGPVTAKCPMCQGAVSSFEWTNREGVEYGAVARHVERARGELSVISHRLFRCAGCGSGALGVIDVGPHGIYPGSYPSLLAFTPESGEKLPLPASVPGSLLKEFREAESCLGHDCFRAAAGLFRSVLEKTMRANGYDGKGFKKLPDKIDAAAGDGIITASRQKAAHDTIRVLGNDVLHDEWREIPKQDVKSAHHYAQRILEDLYDDRESVRGILERAGRLEPDVVASGNSSD